MPRPKKIQKDQEQEVRGKKPQEFLYPKQFVKHYKLKVFNGVLFYLDNGSWSSFDRYPTETIITAVIKEMASELCKKQNKKLGNFSASAVRAIAYRESANIAKLDFQGIVFTNGYVDKDGFHLVEDKSKLPFSPTQVPRDYVEVEKKNWDKTLLKFLAKISGGDRYWMESYMKMLSTCLDNKSWTLFAILFSNDGGTGKSVMLGLLQNILGTNNFTKLKGKEVFNGKNTFALRGINNKSMIVINEMQEKLPGYASEKIKTMADDDYVPFDSKGSNQDKTKMLGTVIATTNYVTQFNEIEDALKDRVQRWEFKNSKNDLTPTEWGKLWEPTDELLNSLLTMLVSAYKLLCNDKKNLRGYKFSSGETDIMWSDNIDNDEVITWIKDNVHKLDGKSIQDIYNEYCLAQKKSVTLPRILTNNVLGKKLNKVMKSKRSNIKGVRAMRYYYEEPKDTSK